MNLVDVHCHLTFDRFDTDREDVIKRAKENGVNLMITSGVNPKTNRAVLELSKKYPHLIRPSFGIYPVDAVAEMIQPMNDDVARDIEFFDVDEELSWIEEHKNDMIAIGEVGLDYKMVTGEEARAKQREIFIKIIT